MKKCEKIEKKNSEQIETNSEKSDYEKFSAKFCYRTTFPQKSKNITIEERFSRAIFMFLCFLAIELSLKSCDHSFNKRQILSSLNVPK